MLEGAVLSKQHSQGAISVEFPSGTYKMFTKNYLHALFLKRFSSSSFISIGRLRSTNNYIQSFTVWAQIFSATLFQIRLLNVYHLPHYLGFSISSIKTRKKDIVEVPDFYQQTVQWKALYTSCKVSVWRLRARRVSVRRSYNCNEDSRLWYPTVCNLLLCVNIISHFMLFIFLYHVLECEWLTGLK